MTHTRGELGLMYVNIKRKIEDTEKWRTVIGSQNTYGFKFLSFNVMKH